MNVHVYVISLHESHRVNPCVLSISGLIGLALLLSHHKDLFSLSPRSVVSQSWDAFCFLALSSPTQSLVCFSLPLSDDDDALDTTEGTGANPEYNLDEPTMEEKLATLNLPNKDNETTGGDAKDQPLSMVMAVPPSADSVHVLLKQALRADDHAPLLNCLYNRDDKVWSSFHHFPFSVQCRNYQSICSPVFLGKQ